jgi:allantoate deiminase
VEAARRVIQRADELAAFTEAPGRITRPLATPSLAAAMARVREWMEDAGLETRSDPLGNVAGRRGEARVVLGSHLDSVDDAGRYDGILGVLVGIEVAAATDVALEVVAFADEDGLRFPGSAFLGSRGYLGRLTRDDLALRDGAGVTLAEAIGAAEPWAGMAPARIDAYLEVHIEQGPVLDAEGLPLGVVTAIAGQSAVAVAFAGRAGHAGTTPMPLRRDALTAAAELVLAAERTARETPGLVATAGRLSVPRGAANVIPGRAEMTLDVRHASDAVRERALVDLRAAAREIAERRGVAVEWDERTVAATACAPALVAEVARAVDAVGAPVRELVSGAGHDAMTLATVTDVAMLFVRCAGGISHHPGESVHEADVALAVQAATQFVRSLACTT